jgi:hypothetical protein
MKGFSRNTDISLFNILNIDQQEYQHGPHMLFQELVSIFPASLCPSSRGFSFLFGSQRLFTQELLRYTFGRPTFREEVAVWKPKPN